MGRKKIAVIGNGHVGTGMLRMFARCPDFAVVGYDPKHSDDTLDGLMRNYRTTSRKDQVRGAALAIVCVPTPQGPDGRCDTTQVEEVLSWVDAPLVVIKSTVPPGFTDRMNRPDVPFYKYGNRVHFSPEYMGEPVNYVPPQYPDPREPWKHDFCIVGGPRAPDVLAYFQHVMATNARYVACSAKEAELCKYMENAYYATKVTFCNEFARIAASMGVDYCRLRELWLLDSRVDRDHTLVLADAPGFDGKCLPKDLSAIIGAAEDAGYVAHLLREVILSNARMRDGARPHATPAESANRQDRSAAEYDIQPPNGPRAVDSLRVGYHDASKE